MILTTNVYAPDGRLLRRGQTLPDDVGEQFTVDVADVLVAESAHPLLKLKVRDDQSAVAAWRKVHEHDQADDPLVVVAADRVRHLAEAAGAHRIARLRPFVDVLPPPDDEPIPDGSVMLHATAHRNRRGSA